jgi:hypothetical protein
MSILAYCDKSPAQLGVDFYGEDMFYEILDLHLMFGHVQSTPDYFVMGRPVDKDASYADLIDIRITYPEDKQNSWCCYFLAGNMYKALHSLPFYLPYCTFEHKGNLKFYELEKLKQRISKHYGFIS